MTRKVFIVTGLGYGDEGKGATVDAIARRLTVPPVVVRHNGGPQAAHNVVTADGRHHTFAQFGSATFVPGALTWLSSKMFVNPFNLMLEERVLQQKGVTDALKRLFVSSLAPIVTQFHVQTNRAREMARDSSRHGSCGEGVGEAAIDLQQNKPMLLMGDLSNRARIKNVLTVIHDRKMEEIRSLGQPIPDNDVDTQVNLYYEIGKRLKIRDHDFLMRSWYEHDVIFEGAQGILLDERYGFHPYSTWSDTTAKAAIEMAHQLPFMRSSPFHIGVIRTYGTRHGPGPFVTESDLLHHPEPHNTNAKWQGQFRIGHHDTYATKYALQSAGWAVDYLAVNHMDRLRTDEEKVCVDYVGADLLNLTYSDGANQQARQERLTRELMAAEPKYETWSTKNFGHQLANYHSLNLFSTSDGPTAENRTFHIHWTT